MNPHGEQRTDTDGIGPAVADSVTLKNPGIRAIVRGLVDQFQAHFAENDAIQNLCTLLRMDIREGATLGDFKKRMDIAGKLSAGAFPPETEHPLHGLERGIAAATRAAIAELLDPRTPLPHTRIIDHQLTRFPESPWYSVHFKYEVRAHGTTGPNHHALVRSPERAAEDGEDLTIARLREYFRGRPVFVRGHSACRYGDKPDPAARCDCGVQYEAAINRIEADGLGCLLYLGQEGRGFGLANKTRALEREDGRRDGAWVGRGDPDEVLTAEHGSPDARRFIVAAKILHELGIANVELHTNNRQKFADIRAGGIRVRATAAAGVATTDPSFVEALTKLKSGRYDATQYYGAIRGILGMRLQDLRAGKPVNPLIVRLLGNILAEILTGNAAERYPEELVEDLKTYKPFILPNGI